MANIFFAGEKASRQEAERSLRQHVAAVCDLRFTVKFESDDGGNHIVLYIEVEDPASVLDPGTRDAVCGPAKWEGWRYMVMKCPIGYIEAIVENKA